MHFAMEAKGLFDKISSAYDSQRRTFIPCFDAFYSAAASVLCAALAGAGRLRLGRKIKILDLGAGTGILSGFVLDAVGRDACDITLLDISGKMLDSARAKFAGMGCVRFKEGDFFSFGGRYDAVCSALAIHHLPDIEKIALYRRIFDSLESGGVFVNAEQVLGETASDILLAAAAREKIIEANLSQDAACVARERLRLDRCQTLSAQTAWLGEIGFASVRCVFENLDFAVFAAEKP